MVYFQVRRPYRTSRSGIARRRSAAPRTNGSRAIRRRTTGRGRSTEGRPAERAGSGGSAVRAPGSRRTTRRTMGTRRRTTTRGGGRY